MQAWYPCLKKKVHPLLQFMVRGGLERFSALHSGVVKGFLWFRVLMRRTRDIQICLVKRTVRRTTGPQTTVEPENTSIYRFYRERERKKESIHTCTEEQACLLSGEEGTSLSIINWTTGLNARLASARRHIYSTVGGAQLKGRQTERMLGSAVEVGQFSGNEYEDRFREILQQTVRYKEFRAAMSSVLILWHTPVVPQ